MAHPRRVIRAGIFGTADSPLHRASTPRDGAPGDRSRRAAAGGLRRRCPLPCLFGGQGARAPHPVGVASRINSGSRRAPAVSTTGPARSASRCTPSTSGNPPRRVRSSTRNAWRSTFPPLFSAEPWCSAGSMSPSPKSCSTPQRKVRPRSPRLTARGRLTHDPPQPFPHSTSTAGGCAISRSRLSVQTARTSLFAGSRCRSPAKGQESCGERLSCRVGGRSGAERRRLASIGHGRTCHSPERRWPSRRSRWSRRWRRSAGPRTSTSAAAISR